MPTAKRLIPESKRCPPTRISPFTSVPVPATSVQCAEAIGAAGGWQHDTLTEDLDLSYRAQLKGWQFVFLPGHVAPPGFEFIEVGDTLRFDVVRTASGKWQAQRVVRA